LELELKDKEIFYRREALANEIAFVKKEKTESDYNRQQLDIERQKYEALIRIYDTYQSAFGSKTEQFRDLEIKKLEAQKKLLETNAQLAPRNVQEVKQLGGRPNTEGVKQSATGSALDQLKSEEELKYALLQAAFSRQIKSEIDFENEKARIRAEYAAKNLEAAQLNGETEKGQIEKLQKEKIDADNQYQETIRANEKRTADLKSELEQVKFGLASQALSVGIELLSKDEAARKKNASAIKAFQIGQITIDGIAEVAAIWKNANANPINALIPGAGTAIAAVQTALAVGRSVAAINRINASKFAKGGIFGGLPHAMGGTKGYFEDGTMIEVEKDEAFAVVNKKKYAATKSPQLRQFIRRKRRSVLR
jgi:hypothetical protein